MVSKCSCTRVVAESTSPSAAGRLLEQVALGRLAARVHLGERRLGVALAAAVLLEAVPAQVARGRLLERGVHVAHLRLGEAAAAHRPLECVPRAGGRGGRRGCVGVVGHGAVVGL
eukprot:scaffold24322_cov81-Phaeocystis_antarctica.AAC.4